MPLTNVTTTQRLTKDFSAGLVVFFVAVPLCIGLAEVSGAPTYLSGILSGVIGGLVVGYFSSSHTSVSGVAPGLIAVIAIQIHALGTYEAFLLAVVVAGCLQMLLGALQAGRLANYIPTSVVRGLLGAVGLILILKQIPHLLGHDIDAEGELSFRQMDNANTFTEFFSVIQGDVHLGAAVIGILSLVILVAWRNVEYLKNSKIPAPLVVVALGTALVLIFRRLGTGWLLEDSHLVHVPIEKSFSGFLQQFRFPDFTRWHDADIYQAGAIIAAAASLETLVNLDAADEVDPEHRRSSPNHELWAQGIGNVLAGLVGALPVTSSIVRSSVNIQAGGKSKWSTMIHGGLLAISVLLFPAVIDLIPLSCLAAVLLVTGWSLINPRIAADKWKKGLPHFIPFVVTIIAIVFSDLLFGTFLGLIVSLLFVLYTNSNQRLKSVTERHLSGTVQRIELPNQLSFLDVRVLQQTLDSIPDGSEVLLDARNTNYIDPDVGQFLRDYRRRYAPLKSLNISLIGFGARQGIEDEVLFVDHCSKEIQNQLTPADVLKALREGNLRYRNGEQLTRDAARSRSATATGQYPMAVLLSCIDSRAPTELVFDLGLGDIFSVRVAGNITSPKVLGSMEYSCGVAGAKLVLVMGHTRCGAVTEAVHRLVHSQVNPKTAMCDHLESIVSDIQKAVDRDMLRRIIEATPDEQIILIDRVARRNVALVMDSILEQSSVLRGLAESGKIAIVGAIYNVASGEIDLFPHLLTQFDLADTDVSTPTK
ncbi:MAG: bifunctional SulP family inorganic anion transporter/carbonic anhydrase [Planctomycetaceae bacterium]|nr:bifunctional SulP family inorganic anion transporter/carbonic anhydrase [Planctomycetaceae bacterium]MCB9952815.1 bifunctional SulP family inorganic anion transporter/carbonic anhydrase [Planctomycetaceae bacterium]